MPQHSLASIFLLLGLPFNTNAPDQQSVYAWNSRYHIATAVSFVEIVHKLCAVINFIIDVIIFTISFWCTDVLASVVAGYDLPTDSSIGTILHTLLLGTFLSPSRSVYCYRILVLPPGFACTTKANATERQKHFVSIQTVVLKRCNWHVGMWMWNVTAWHIGGSCLK